MDAGNWFYLYSFFSYCYDKYVTKATQGEKGLRVQPSCKECLVREQSCLWTGNKMVEGHLRFTSFLLLI